LFLGVRRQFSAGVYALVHAAATIQGLELFRRPVIVRAGNFRTKNTNAGKWRYEEEHMALNVTMTIIAICIPLLLYTGCIMTRKKKAPDLSKVAPHYELDRAA
jgi:hypothetical protein